MVEKYRVQFNNEIIGPYTAEEIKKLVRKGYFPRFIRCSPLSDNEWYNLLDIPGFEDLTEESVTESSLVHKLKDQFGGQEEKTVMKKNLKRKKDQIVKKQIDTTKQHNIAEKDDIDLSATLITKDTYDYLEDNKKGIEKNLEKALTTDDRSHEDKTQFYDLEEIKNALVEADETERGLVPIEEDPEEEKKEVVASLKNKAKPKKKSMITILVGLVLLFLLLDDDSSTSNNSKFISPQFNIPILGKTVNEDKALSILDSADGLTDYKLKDLLKKASYGLKAARYSEDDSVLMFLADSYVNLLPYSNNLRKDGAKVFKLLQIVKGTKDLQRANTVDLKARFYFNVNKADASVYLVEQYMKLNEKISESLTATYLRSLLKVGNIKGARRIVNSLISRERLNASSYIAILEYLNIENNYKDYGSAFARAYNDYPESIEILFHGVRYYIFIKKYEKVKDLLEIVEDLKYERNKDYYSRYLESIGVVLAMSGNYEKAKKFFSDAIAINPESEIIAKLATLENDKKYSEISQLIAKSKAINFMLKARKYLGKRNFELALTNAINATDSYPDYTPAKKLLIEIQIEYGYLEEAIKGVEKLKKSSRKDSSIDILLLKAYSHSYKFREGLVTIQELNQKLGDNPEYAEVVATFYEKKGDPLRSILWLQKAIKINPLQETALYRLAKIYLENNQFDRAKIIITRLIDLNPSKVDYRILYADVIYEIQDVDTALGYLRGILKDNPDNIKVENKIAVFFYRSGQIKSFESLKAEINEKDQVDAELYLFLMKAAQIEQKYSEVIKNAEQYLSFNRADHNIRILLAKNYFDLGKYDEAENVLFEIQEKISSYPRLHYMLSKIAFLKGDSDSAVKLAEKEISLNPYSPYGYIQLGNVFKANKEFAKAEVQYKKAQRLEQGNIELLKGLGEVKFRRNQLEAALDIFKKVLETSEQVEVEVHYQIGEVYRYLGQSRLAVESYKTYLELNPEADKRETIEAIIMGLK